MLSCHAIGAGMSPDYFAKDGYYTRTNTAHDRWEGTLAKIMELEGQVTKEQFEALYDKLVESGRKRVAMDCAFSAPKSVSLAMAESPETRGIMQKLHQEAVSCCVNYIEENYIKTRVKKNSHTYEVKTGNCCVAEFEHYTSRNNDLDLHTHVVVENMTIHKGKVYSIEFGNLLQDQKEVGLVYRQYLAAALQREGYTLEVTDKKYGFFELKGFDREIIMEHSTRRQEIIAVMEKTGGKSAADAQNAAMKTRKKKGAVDLKKSYEEIHKELFQSGKIKIERNDSYKHSAERDDFMLRSDGGQRRQRINDIATETVKKISSEKFAFTVPEVRQRIMGAGVLEGITCKEAERAMQRIGLVKLGRIEHGAEKSKDVYLTTVDNIKRERDIIDRMKEGKGQIKALTQEQSEASFDKLNKQMKAEGKSITPNAEQISAIHHVLTSQDRYLCIQGLAGTGKTYTMTNIRKLCEQEGITIRGACFTGKAADGLQNESGIPSSTIHSFLNQLEAGKFNEDSPIKEVAKNFVAEAKPRKVDNEAIYEQHKKQIKQDGIKQEWSFSKVEKAKGREIWIVDEAGLVDNRLMEHVQKAAEARGAQVVLSGDYQQFPPVGAGEPMKAMIEAGVGAAYLEDIRRQTNIELLESVRESVKGDHIKTFENLAKSGDYHEIKDKQERHQAITKEITRVSLHDYIETKADGDPKLNQLLLVSTNADRKTYNNEIRAEYVKCGELEKGQQYKITSHSGNEETIEKRNFAAGDRVIFTANDNKLDVKNGTLGTIEKIENNHFTVRTDVGQQKQFYIDKYNNMDHSYAVTNYKAQGMGVEKVVADMNTKSKDQDRNALYVNVSRAKEKAIVYTDNKQKLEKQTKDFAQKITSKDFTHKIQQMERGNRIENNDCYHAPEKLTIEKVIRKMEQEPPKFAQYKAYEKQKAQELIQEQTRKLERQKTMEHQKTIKYGIGMGFSR